MTRGEIYIVSTGTGDIKSLTASALEAINKAELVVGYNKYIKDIASILGNKEIYSTGMTHEVERCKYAVKEALSKKVALISNGDANVFGMAGLVLEIIEENNLWNKLDVHIEPGITSVLAAAAKTGAPVMQDFAVISLSNLLTPMEVIEKRLKNALEADFVIGLYNPLSHSRKEPYEMFLSFLKDNDNKDTPVIIAQNIGRDTENILIKTVNELLEYGTDTDIINMSTVLIIGNSSTKLVDSGKKVVTQRGYHKNYEYKL